MINEKKIDFIICTNDENQLSEAAYYISKLVVPEEYEIDLLEIWDAKSIFAGYNEAMNSSTAKYKVYLHQDVRIINSHFLVDILRIFEDDSVGMIGMVGASKLNRQPWLWDAGAVIETRVTRTTEEKFTEINKDIEVKEIDGLLMATQYDLPWREDILSGWDLYDRSQSIEFLKKSFKIVVPYQNRPWCLHDCGVVSLDRYWDSYNTFMNHYNSFFLN